MESVTVPTTVPSTLAVMVLPEKPSDNECQRLVPSAAVVPLRNDNAGRCLDVPNVSQTNGTQVTLWDCNGGSNQQWTVNTTKQIQVYGNKCLDAEGSGTAPGTRVVIWDCTGGTNQQWNVNTDGTITGVQSGLCLAPNSGGTANSTPVTLQTCNGATSQKWTRS